MGVVQPGRGQRRGRGQESGQKPPDGGDRAFRSRRLQAKGQAPGAAPSRAVTAPGAGSGPGGARGKGRPNAPVPVAAPRRFSSTTLAFVSAGVVVVVVVALVIFRVTTSSGPGTNNAAPVLTSASPSVLAKVQIGIGDPVVSAVGLPSSLNPPSVDKGQPALISGGKPEAFYIGGDFCPSCATERWAIIMAFSRFGTFTGLDETTSSPWDSPPAIHTFSFVSAKYRSNYVVLNTVESETNDTGPNGAGRKPLQPIPSKESSLWAKYAAHFGVIQGFPFVDFGNNVFVLGATYDPNTLRGLDQEQIASKLKNAQDPVTQGIVGTASYLTAAICSITGDQPSSVCSAPIVTQAAHALGVS